MLGYGHTGRALVPFFLARGILPFVSERNSISERDCQQLRQYNVSYEEGGHSKAALHNTELMALSPGIPIDCAVVRQAKDKGIPVMSEIDIAYRYCAGVPIIAVSGTNGKSTTSTLISLLLKLAGWKTVLAGNIGTPLVSTVDDTASADTLVVEVSSFQLEQSKLFHPQIAVMLNLSSDHLSRHKTMSAYTNAKARLFLNQNPTDTAIIPHELQHRFPNVSSKLVAYNDIQLPDFAASLAPHNRSNLQAAISACMSFDSTFSHRTIALSDLQPAFSLPYRLQTKGTINEVTIINDSKSTNAASTIAALRSVRPPIVLLLGGQHKQAGYEDLAGEIASTSIRSVITYGSSASYLHRVLESAGCQSTTVSSDLEQAVSRGLQVAHPGDTLLFSPACSSYDQYKNYKRRGAAFCSIIQSYPSFSSTPLIS